MPKPLKRSPTRKPALESLRERREEAEQERLKAWAAVYVWRGQRLLPYSLGREEVWESLCRAQGGAETATAWLLLLYVCSQPGEVLAGQEGASLLPTAEAWVDANVERWETQEALELARKILADSRCTMARLKPSDRKSDPDNAAWPVWQASYIVMVSAAVQGSLTPWQIEWELSLACGRALCHGRWIYDGSPTLWMDREASKTGAWLADYRRRHEARLQAGGRLIDIPPE